MATAFAFGIACGSASCLREKHSVFDIEDYAMEFLRGCGRLFSSNNVITLSRL